MGSYVSLVLLTRTTSNVNAVLVAGGGVEVVDEDGDAEVVDRGDEIGAEVDVEEVDAGVAEEGTEDSKDIDEVEDIDEDTAEAASDVLDNDERMPTLTPNGAVADALALVWDNVVLILSGPDPVEVDVTIVEAFDLDDVLTSTVELVVEMASDVARESKDETKLEDEYNVAVDVELIYSVVVEYSVIVVQVVGDCAIVRPIHAPVARKIVLFMIDIRCEGASCTRNL